VENVTGSFSSTYQLRCRISVFIGTADLRGIFSAPACQLLASALRPLSSIATPRPASACPVLPHSDTVVYHTCPQKSREKCAGVMSSCLSKKAEGAVPPLFVAAVEDRENDAVAAGGTDEADHGSGATPHFHKAPCSDIGGAQPAPQVPRELDEGEQFRQVLPQLPYHGGVDGLPVQPEPGRENPMGSEGACQDLGDGVDWT